MFNELVLFLCLLVTISKAVDNLTEPLANPKLNKVHSYKFTDLCSEDLTNNNLSKYDASNDIEVVRQNCGCNANGPCFTKCCKPGYFFTKNKTIYTCHKKATSHFSTAIYLQTEKAGVVEFPKQFFAGPPENCRTYQLHPETGLAAHLFYLQTNGDLYIPSESLYIPNDRYCIDNINNSDNKVFAVVCYQPDSDIINEKKEKQKLILGTGMIISMPFLLATFLVYTLLPERNLHAKALMFYALSLFFGYLILVIIQLSKVNFPTEVCQALGFCVQFFFILSFFWMNVICADIYLTFSGHRGFSGGKRSAETKRFILYCLYACGMSFLITLITFLVNTFADNNATWHPNIGNGQCFFRGTWPELLYFYGPMGLILATNMIFFAITAYRIRQAKKDTSVLKKEDSKRHSYENDKQNFNLYLRLLLAMGINWTMELISWAVQAAASEVPNYIWYVTDFCNAIYGLFIFLLFVFKKKIWKLLKKRYYTFIGKPQFGHFTSTTNQTRTSNYSTAETSLTDNHHHSIHREEIPLRTST